MKNTYKFAISANDAEVLEFMKNNHIENCSKY